MVTEGVEPLQHDYYARTADKYDKMQVHEGDEHFVALGWMASMIQHRHYSTILDIGSGTGRVLSFLQCSEELSVKGIEPSSALREIGYSKGISPDQLVDGNALELPYQDDSFDLVCSFGVLHHIKDHRRAVSEMTRVAAKAVFISDSNNFGQGSRAARMTKLAMKAMGLWRAFDLIRTRGKGYHFSEGDGVFYSYSLFDDLDIIGRKFPRSLYLSTRPSGPNLYRSAQTVAVFSGKH